jgi:uncharacterized YigZ family protein
MENEHIKTIKDFNELNFKEKGSEFIAQVHFTDTEAGVNSCLEKAKKRYFDASHHCYAYRFSNGEFKYSDDREPKGTAGIRILNAIEHFDLSNVLIVVIRYFGGTKLGVGPLGKAYYKSASNVINNSNILLMNLFQQVLIKSDFSFLNHIHRVISSFNAIIVKSEFTDSAAFNCLIKPADIQKVSSELVNLSNGKILIQPSSCFKYF